MPLRFVDKGSLVYSYSIYTLDYTKPLNLTAITGAISVPIKGHFTMQRNANIEQTSEMNKDFFVISQRVKQISAVYCKYAKISKKSAFLQILWVSLQKSSPLSVPRINFCPSQ